MQYLLHTFHIAHSTEIPELPVVIFRVSSKVNLFNSPNCKLYNYWLQTLKMQIISIILTYTFYRKKLQKKHKIKKCYNKVHICIYIFIYELYCNIFIVTIYSILDNKL